MSRLHTEQRNPSFTSAAIAKYRDADRSDVTLECRRTLFFEVKVPGVVSRLLFITPLVTMFSKLLDAAKSNPFGSPFVSRAKCDDVGTAKAASASSSSGKEKCYTHHEKTANSCQNRVSPSLSSSYIPRSNHVLGVDHAY